MASDTDAELHHVCGKRLGVYWVIRLEDIGRILQFLGLGVAAAGGLFFGKITVYTGLALIAISFAMIILQGVLFNRLNKCPFCGHNSTRRKDGKPRKDLRKVEAQIARLTECPQGHSE